MRRAAWCARRCASCGALLRRQLSRGREGRDPHAGLTREPLLRRAASAAAPPAARPRRFAVGARPPPRRKRAHAPQQPAAARRAAGRRRRARRARACPLFTPRRRRNRRRRGAHRALPPRFDDRATAAGLVSAPTRSAPSAPHTRSIGAAGEPPSRSPPDPPLSGEPRQRSMVWGAATSSPTHATRVRGGTRSRSSWRASRAPPPPSSACDQSRVRYSIEVFLFTWEPGMRNSYLRAESDFSVKYKIGDEEVLLAAPHAALRGRGGAPRCAATAAGARACCAPFRCGVAGGGAPAVHARLCTSSCRARAAS